jgi:hypothetical protein
MRLASLTLRAMPCWPRANDQVNDLKRVAQSAGFLEVLVCPPQKSKSPSFRTRCRFRP